MSGRSATTIQNVLLRVIVQHSIHRSLNRCFLPISGATLGSDRLQRFRSAGEYSWGYGSIDGTCHLAAYDGHAFSVQIERHVFASHLVYPLLNHFRRLFGVCLVLLGQVVALCYLGVGLVFYKPLILFGTHFCFHHHKSNSLVTLVFTIPFCNVFQLYQLLCVAPYHDGHESLVGLCHPLGILYTVHQRIFIALYAEELETERTCHLREVSHEEVLCRSTKLDDLVGIKETGGFQLFLDFLYLIARQGGE